MGGRSDRNIEQKVRNEEVVRKKLAQRKREKEDCFRNMPIRVNVAEVCDATTAASSNAAG